MPFAGAEYVGRASHVLFHQLHTGRALDIETARIETNALADKRHPGRLGRPPSQIDQPRSDRRGPTDRMDRR